MVRVINHIKEIRQQKNISQVKMAQDLQITRQTINAIEKNKYNPSLELALKLLAYFDVSLEQLFYLEEEKGNK
ncbi:helix-turn-helix transcriptional regulator [Bacillus sp. 2205SS5-2]|uniref:helix-turn-helix transcriptional regulator n=1 Tax=Bacillus sp. 2205SS5-2 TaxID=3109031 RepID=UPI003004C406